MDTLYFLTWGPESCGRGPVNFWKLESNEFTVSSFALDAADSGLHACEFFMHFLACTEPWA